MDTQAVDTAQQERSFDRLQRMGIVAREQVLLLLPTGYRDYTNIRPYLPSNEALYPVQKACYSLQVISTPNRAATTPPRLSFDVTDGCNNAKVTVFGDVWTWQNIKKGENIKLEAVVDIWEGRLQLKSPTLLSPSMAGRLMPTYRGKRGANRSLTISPDFVYEKTREALALHLDATVDYIKLHFPSLDEEYLIKRAGLPCPSLREMLIKIHAPKTVEEGESGLSSARSLAAFEVVFNAEQQMAKKPNTKSVINIHEALIDKLIAKFPHELTEHQKTGIKDIVEDLRRPFPMNRLLSGDVGFGKTDVALIPAIAAQMSGAKVVIMCPSLLIVNQWAEKIEQYDKKIPIQIVSNGTKVDKTMLPSNPIMVGTTALVTRLPKLGYIADYIVFDEQQKHGKNQKESLVGQSTNRLDATATCQPKTAAMVNYGGMDETILNQCPVQKKIHTRIVHQSEKARLFAHIQRILSEVADAQVAIVYPKVTAGEAKESLLSSIGMWEKKFPGQVGVLHGKMTDDEKTNVIKQMHAKEIRVLLSSVLIETGITLPSLRGMVVIGADRFGVSALHQLRGRLARHGGVGYFYMLTPTGDMQDDTMERLQLLEKHSDGFVLAEKDAEMRGFGSMGEDDESQSGVSRSAMFFGLRLMPKDIERALTKT